MLRTTKHSVSLLMLLAAGLLAVGCSSGDDDDGVATASGDDGNGSESASSDREQSEEDLLDWVDCMQGEGIDISDPTRDSDGNLVLDSGPIQIGSPGESNGPSTNEQQPSGDEPELDPEEMQAATEKCGNPPMVVGDMAELSPEDEERMQQAALDFSECMREQGIEDFPDPDFSQSGPGGAPTVVGGGPSSEASPNDDQGSGPVNRVVGPFGEIDLTDPQTKAAFDACQHIMEDAAPEGAGGPSTDSGDAGT